jgi:DNA-binding NarL/FixJ family response regulator
MVNLSVTGRLAMDVTAPPVAKSRGTVGGKSMDVRAKNEAPSRRDDEVYGHYVRIGDDEYAILSIPAGPPPLPACLTDAERHVCELVIAGESNASIARERGTSVRTIANQLASIYRKLNVYSRCELVAQLHGCHLEQD